MNTCTCVCISMPMHAVYHNVLVCLMPMHVYACCIGVYDASVCLLPTRKTQMKKMQTTRAVLKTVHC